MDKLETNLTKVTEQLQALTTAMANMAVPCAGGGSENVRLEEPPNRLSDEIHVFDDDMAEYVAWRIAKSQIELQKLRDQLESVTHKMRGKHEDLLDYEAMTFEE